MKKIIIMNDLLYGGGAEKILIEISKYLCTYPNNKLYIAASNATSKKAKQLIDKRVRYINWMHPVNNSDRWSPKWIANRIMIRLVNARFQIWKMLHVFDVAVAMKEGHCMAQVSQLNSKKKVAWIHVDYNYLHWTKGVFLSNRAELDCMKKFDHVICVSQATMESVKNTVGDPGNLCVCYNPIDYKSIHQKSEEYCLFEKTTDRPLIVSVGRLDQQKQFDLLIEACGELERSLEFELWIIGEGPERLRLEQIIDKQGIQSVKLLGFCENPYPMIKKADLVVSSSKAESYGLVIQEALILGVPVVATYCPAIEETLPAEYGLIVENSYRGLINGLRQMITEQTIRDGFKQAIQENYDYNDLLDNRLRKINDILV